ncbi:MAG TPA: polysaccharide biosynthesis tyrosine autokinase [Stellaceae bacterium]|jgi:exopolysaccharide transport family protein|nr:polysaccharide biosynthesis tyrosine autokinase [Stellaceae bacterium]
MADRNLPTASELNQMDQGFDLRETISFIWRQWKFTLGITAIAVLVGAVHLSRVTPLYTATAQVLLDAQREKPPGGESVFTNAILDSAVIESQMTVIKSSVLLRRVVEKEHLTLEPAAAAGASETERQPPPLIDRVLYFFTSLAAELGGDATDTARSDKLISLALGNEVIPPNELRSIEGLKAALRVTRIAQQGYVLGIAFTSPDPAKAARMANAIADAYLVDKLDTRFEAAKRASAWLSDRLLGLREQLHDSEEAVTQFRAANGLMQSSGSTLTQQQLSDLNGKLIDAKTELEQKKARVGLLNSLQAKGGNLQNMPDITNSGALPTLRQQAANLSAQEADLTAHYGASHPLVVNIRAQLADVERSIGSEVARMAASIKNDYELAQSRVTSLQAALAQATGQYNLDDATAIHLRELERTAAANKTLYEDFLKQAKITQEQSTFEPQEVRIISPALPPGIPSYPRRLQFLAVNLFIGLLLGIGGALAKEKLNTGFTTPKQVEDLLGLPVLTSVSHLTSRELKLDKGTLPLHEYLIARPLSRYGEAMRSLRSGIQMTDVDNPPRVIQLTSAVPGEGKTTIALSLAASAATAKLKVLLIDADLRHPTATSIFRLQKEPGLVDLLLGDTSLNEAVKWIESSGFSILPAGNKTQNPTDLLGSERMKVLILDLKESYDLIFIDTPPAGPVVDPVVISHLTDKIVFVVRWAATARELVRPCVDLLSAHRKIAGVAFNRVNVRQAQKYGKHAYSYYYGSRYYKNYYSK